MKRHGLTRAFAGVALCLCALFVSPQEAQARTQYIFLIDTSGSMIGLPAGSGNAVIFPKVQAELIRYLEGLDLGDMVDLRTFQDGVSSARVFRIESESERQSAIAHVRDLRAGGGSGETHIYRSILDTARLKVEEAKRFDSLESPTIFYVLTDGLDNDPQGTTMREMLSEYAELRQENDFLIYVTLAVNLSPEDSKALEESPHASHHTNPDEVVRIGTIEVRARRLDFGFVEGEVSDPRALALQLHNLDPFEVELRLQPSFPDLEASGAVVEVEPATADMEASKRIRLRIINRESLPESRFQGEIRLSTDRSYVHLAPDRIAVALSTVPDPAATLTLPGDAIVLDFGESRVGSAEPPAIRAQVEFNASARTGRSGFYLDVTPDGTGLPAPAVTWNGQHVAGDRLLTSDQRFNELVIFWEKTPAAIATHEGTIVLLPERLALRGEALRPTGENGFSIPYRLTMRPALWMRIVLGAVVLMGVLAVLAVAAWLMTGTPPWEALRLSMVRTGVVTPRLSGKLVYHPPGGERLEHPLSGKSPVLLGADTERWGWLPNQMEISARVHKGTEGVAARCTAGTICYQSIRLAAPQRLTGQAQALSHLDTLLLSDGSKITYVMTNR